MSETIQIYIVYILQIILALTLINVWLIHFSKPTKFRAHGAQSMRDEFKVYGLPEWFMHMVGFSKILIALSFILGLWIPSLIYPASVFLAALMTGAIVMHIKVKDSLVRTLPAIIVLVMAITLSILI